MRDVFDHLHAVLARDLQDRIHIRRIAEVVNRHNRLRAIGDAMLDIGWVDAESLRIDLGKDDGAAQGVGLETGRPVGEAGADDLVADAHATGVHRRLQRRSAGAKAKGILRPLPLRELLLEELGDVASRHRPPVQNIQNGLFVLLRDDRPIEHVAGIGLYGLGPAKEREHFTFTGCHRLKHLPRCMGQRFVGSRAPGR